MYQCGACRKTFYPQSDRCPHCGIRFAYGEAKDRLLPSIAEERYKERRSKERKNLSLNVSAVLLTIFWLLVLGPGLGALVAWGLGYAPLSGAKWGALALLLLPVGLVMFLIFIHREDV